MLQQEEPKDYVIATGKTYTVREFVERAFEYANLNYKDYVEVSKDTYDPAEVDLLLGDPSKAIKDLGWNPAKTSLDELIKMMVDSDLSLLRLKK